MARKYEDDWIKETLPYGKWTTALGREVLFNRHYQPIWQRIDDVVTEANRQEWVDGIVAKEHFYVDYKFRKDPSFFMKLCRDVLAEWGVVQVDYMIWTAGVKRR